MQKKHFYSCALLFAWVATQLFHTFTDSNNWPFSSYNMFNRIPKPIMKTYVADIYSSDGSILEVSASNLLPIEFFRANPIMHQVFNGKDIGAKARFEEQILNRINHRPWKDFDEVRGSPKSKTPFVALKISIASYSFDQDRQLIGKKWVYGP